jgi:integrase
MSLSFSDLALAIVVSYTGRDPSFATRVDYWVSFFEHSDITTITNDDVEDGIDALVQRGKIKVLTTTSGVTKTLTGEPLSPSTVNRYVACLGTVFKELKRKRLLPRGFISPMRGVSRMEESEGRTLTVSIDDVKRLVAACRVSRNRKLAALAAMACTTGWRKGTIQSMTWGQINLVDGYADTPRTKNGKPHRTPLLPWVVKELARIKPDFATDRDEIFGRKNFDRAFHNALKLADLPEEWTFHHCRHIAASILAQSGASVVTIMQALNHKTPLMAIRYSHLNTDSLRESLGRAWA